MLQMLPGPSAIIYPGFVIIFDPAEFVDVNVTVYVPNALYVYSGFCSVLVPPSPKSHDHDVGELVEVSVN